MTGESIKKKLLATTLLVGLSGSIWASAAVAQDTDAPVSTVVTEETDEDTAVQERVLVTGSRIKRAGIDTVRPAIVVDQQVFNDRAFTNVADALNELPSFGAGVDDIGGQNGFSVGQQFVDLFDLGPERTLTLINGRRFVSGGVPVVFGSGTGLAVDFNVIPSALIANIEVVPLAGAAIYGTDAISGTINATLRDDYEGFEIGGQYGVTEFGDGDEYQLQAVFGSNFADGRGNVAGSIEYSSSQGVVLGDRQLFSNNAPFFSTNINPGFTDIAFGSILTILSAGGSVSAADAPNFFGQDTPGFIPNFAVGAIDGQFLEFEPDGTLVACDPGFPTTALFSNSGGIDNFEPTCGIDLNQASVTIRSPTDRINFTTFGHYDITDNIRVTAEAIISNAEGADELNQGGFNTQFFGSESGALTFETSNPFLSTQARDLLEGAGLTSFGLNRFNNDLVSGGIDTSETFAWRTVLGIEGDFETAGRNFTWDVAGSFGQSDFESVGTGIIQGRFVNAIDAVQVDQALLDATGVTLAQLDGIAGGGPIELGSIVCQAVVDAAAGTPVGANTPATGGGTTADELPFVTGCVPLNLFGEGAGSPEALAFIQSNDLTIADNAQQVYTVNFGGELVELPAGWVQFSVGYEHREDSAFFLPGTGTSLGVTRSAPFNATGGEQVFDDFFGEVFVPLVSPDNNIPLVNLLEFEGAIRYQEFESIPDGVFAIGSSQTNEDDDITYSVGGRYRPVRDLTIRGSYNEAIRAPTLVELFTPPTQIFTIVGDPCDVDNINDGPTPEIRQANCAAIGITQPFTSFAADGTIIGANTGNPFLEPETAESWTVGFTLEPRWVEGLVISADYFNIEITDFIDGVSATDFAVSCFDDPDFSLTDPSGACQQITRSADGQITFAQSGFDNSDFANFEAVQIQANYDFNISDKLRLLPGNQFDNTPDLGDLGFNLSLFRNITTEQSNEGEAPQNIVGGFGTPTLSGTLDTTYTYDRLRLFWRLAFQDEPELGLNTADIFRDIDLNEIDGSGRPIFLNNVSASYEIIPGTSIQLNVDNVFGATGSLTERAAGFITGSNQLGRTFTVRFRSAF